MIEKRRKCFIRATCKVKNIKENVHKKVRERWWKRRSRRSVEINDLIPRKTFFTCGIRA